VTFVFASSGEFDFATLQCSTVPQLKFARKTISKAI
jgi:hypothetical protein